MISKNRIVGVGHIRVRFCDFYSLPLVPGGRYRQGSTEFGIRSLRRVQLLQLGCFTSGYQFCMFWERLDKESGLRRVEA